MRIRWIPVLTVAAVAASSAAMVQAPRHLNPVVDLLAQKKAVFGLYAPANRRPGRGGAVPAEHRRPKTPAAAGEGRDRELQPPTTCSTDRWRATSIAATRRSPNS